jgi:hypothetical protein
MTYYILYPGDRDTAVINDINQLGEDNRFGVFWASGGFQVLQKAINENHDIINHFRILDDKNRSYTIEEFLDKIKNLKVRINNG